MGETRLPRTPDMPVLPSRAVRRTAVTASPIPKPTSILQTHHLLHRPQHLALPHAHPSPPWYVVLPCGGFRILLCHSRHASATARRSSCAPSRAANCSFPDGSPSPGSARPSRHPRKKVAKTAIRPSSSPKRLNLCIFRVNRSEADELRYR